MYKARISLKLIALALLLSSATAGCRHAPREPDPRPSIIFICADDLDWESLFAKGDDGTRGVADIQFPALGELAQQGMVFVNFHATTPVCAPSRATFLSGQYAHRHRLRVNNPASRLANGFPGGAREFDATHSLGPWIQATGYHTSFIGKYLHDDFEPRSELAETWASIIPPGWDRFRASLSGLYENYHCVDSAAGKAFEVNGVYRTDAEADSVIDTLESWSPGDAPQFICWMPLAPHASDNGEFDAPPRIANQFGDRIPPDLDRHLAEFPENLPEELQQLPALNSSQRDHIIDLYRERLRATLALDEAIARIRDSLQAQGRLQNTILVITSDHGFRLGEHRHVGKRMPYDRITRVPLIIAGAGVAQGECARLVANIDMAPTLVDLAGGTVPAAPDSIDGLSFRHLLTDPQAEMAGGREAILIENWETEIFDRVLFPATYTTLRSTDAAYIEWAGGGREYYDLAADPGQLRNLYPALDEERRQQLAVDLRAIARPAMDPLPGRLLHSSAMGETADRAVNTSFRPIAFSGFVEDDSAIAKVEVELYCQSTGEYWNGQRWQQEMIRLPASLDNPGGLMTRWHFSVDTSPGNAYPVTIEERNVALSVYGEDDEGNRTAWRDAQRLVLRLNDPETWIDRPGGSVQGCRPTTFTGTAADNGTITGVRLIINDKDNGLFWDGKRWIAEYATVDAEVDAPRSDGRVVWRYDFTGSSEYNVFVGARAIDEQKFFDRSVAYFEFPRRDEPSPPATNEASQ